MPDVAVVGGGIVGAACAYELARAGASVTLIERDELAAGASGRTQGWFVLPEDPVLEPMARATLPEYLDVAASAALPVWIDPEPVGHLLVALESQDVPRAQHALSSASAQGVEIRPLDATELREAEPAVTSDAVAGWLLHQGHRLDPAALTVALALAAKASGADIRHHLRVRALIEDGDTIRGVVTDDGPIHADTVVVAAGPWSTSLLDPIGIRMQVSGARGWIVRVAPSEGSLRHLIEHAGWRDAPERLAAVARPSAARVATDGMPQAEVGALLHLHPDGTVLVGSSRQAWITPEPEDPSVPRRQLAAAIRLVPSLAEARVLSAWWGLRPITPDERPLVGAVRDGLVVATGHGSEGVILGAGTAKLVTSIVMGGSPPFDPAPFDPFRFDPWRGSSVLHD
ncbi:MAG: NAD(P)/FAD-dependent oxidoreductase [Actinomycetota bacterium]